MYGDFEFEFSFHMRRYEMIPDADADAYMELELEALLEVSQYMVFRFIILLPGIPHIVSSLNRLQKV